MPSNFNYFHFNYTYTTGTMNKIFQRGVDKTIERNTVSSYDVDVKQTFLF